jgi:hypothetical protein
MEPTLIADRQSWKNSPAPSMREEFKVAWTFPPAMATRMIAGHIPEDMNDRWFIFLEDGWLLFHRSWTGNCIFGLKLEVLSVGVTITEGWVSRKTDEYSSTDVDKDVELVQTLVNDYFRFP